MEGRLTILPKKGEGVEILEGTEATMYSTYLEVREVPHRWARVIINNVLIRAGWKDEEFTLEVGGYTVTHTANSWKLNPPPPNVETKIDREGVLTINCPSLIQCAVYITIGNSKPLLEIH